MSHGWCRLNLRQEVLEVDALMSAMLYEEMLASRNGKLRRCSVCVCVACERARASGNHLTGLKVARQYQ